MTTQEKIDCLVLAEKVKDEQPELAGSFPHTRWAHMSNYQKSWLLMWVRTGKQPTCSPTCCKNVSRLNLAGIVITPMVQLPRECFKYMEATGSIHYHDISCVV